jgi:hypothetical protein
MATYKHLRSSTANKRPTTSIADGQLAFNTNATSPGLFFKDSTGATIIKIGPVHVGTTAPNATPGAGGSSGNSTGEVWLDTSITPVGVKIWNGSAWVNGTPTGSTTVQGLLELATDVETQSGSDAARAVTPAGLQSKVSNSISTTSSTTIASSTAVKAAYDLAAAGLPRSGGTVTGNLEIGTTGSLTFEGSVADGFETALAATNPTADRVITLPDISGTVVTTGDTGSVTSAMIANGAIVSGDIASGTIVDSNISASAEIAVSKLADGAAGQIIQTDSAGTGVEWSDTANLPLGSAAAPAYRFQGDTNTGIYSPGEDQVAISTNGVTRFTITDSGIVRIGPGSTQPLATVPFGANVHFDGIAPTPNAGTYHGVAIVSRGGDVFGGAAAEALHFYSAGWNSSASITHGVSGFGSSLTLSGSDDIIISAAARGVVYGETSAELQAGGGGLQRLIAKTNELVINDIGIDYDFRVEGDTNANLFFVDASTERIGIGTSSPGSLLHVKGSATGTTLQVEGSASGDYTALQASNPSGAQIQVASNGNSNIDIKTTTNHSMLFYTNNIERFRIGAAGTTTFNAPATTPPWIANIGASEVARIDSSGRLLVGTSSGYVTSTSATTQPLLQIHSTNTHEAQVSINSWSTGTATGANLSLCRSDSGTVGTHTAVGSTDVLGTIRFSGSDGDQFIEGASIAASADGTWGDNDGPTKLVFSTTADGASSPTERLRIDSAGQIEAGSLGIAAAPVWSFLADPNTGIYSPGADQVAISTNGTGRLLIEADGDINIDSGGVFYDATNNRLAIGTTSPATTLDVNGDVTITDKIIHGGDTNTAIRFPAADTVSVETAGSERARIDSSGRLLVGTSSAYTTSTGVTPRNQLAGLSNDACSSIIYNFQDDATTSGLTFAKSRGGSLGTQGLIADGNTIGSILFEASDGTQLRRAALISAAVDGTPGADDMPGRLVFSTTANGASSPTERMRIDSTGRFYLGATTEVSPSQTTAGLNYDSANKVLNLSRSGSGCLNLQRTTSDGAVATFYRDTTLVGTIGVTTIATSFNTSSDYRLKENVVPLTGAIDRVNDLQVHRFNFIADPDTVVDGFIAHEAQEVVPECVTGTKDEVDADGNPVYQGIDQSKLVPLLTAALQEALAEIESLKARVTALEP